MSRQPDTAIVLNATGYGLTYGGRIRLAFCDRGAKEATVIQAVADMGATPIPAFLFYNKIDRKLLASLPLPKTVPELRSTVTTFGHFASFLLVDFVPPCSDTMSVQVS